MIWLKHWSELLINSSPSSSDAITGKRVCWPPKGQEEPKGRNFSCVCARITISAELNLSSFFEQTTNHVCMSPKNLKQKTFQTEIILVESFSCDWMKRNHREGSTEDETAKNHPQVPLKTSRDCVWHSWGLSKTRRRENQNNNKVLARDVFAKRGMTREGDGSDLVPSAD